MLSESFDLYIESKTLLIEKQLNELVIESTKGYNSLLKAARYSLLSGGKRLRPLLALATAESFGSTDESVIQPACALELIHTYSLIHDDLPCMDDDDFRRGKPSLHKVYPEGHAVLAGDFLLTHAFAIIAKAPGLSAQQKIELVNILSSLVGADGLIGGQVIDIESEDKSLDLAELQMIHELKTGALITASVLFGGVIAGASRDELQILQKFGREIGLAFQIIDDVLDVTTEKNSDKKNNKTTYVTLMGLDGARDLAYSHFEKALDLLNKLPCDSSMLAALAKRLVKRNK